MNFTFRIFFLVLISMFLFECRPTVCYTGDDVIYSCAPTQDSCMLLLSELCIIKVRIPDGKIMWKSNVDIKEKHWINFIQKRFFLLASSNYRYVDIKELNIGNGELISTKTINSKSPYEILLIKLIDDSIYEYSERELICVNQSNSQDLLIDFKEEYSWLEHRLQPEYCIWSIEDLRRVYRILHKYKKDKEGVRYVMSNSEYLVFCYTQNEYTIYSLKEGVKVYDKIKLKSVFPIKLRNEFLLVNPFDTNSFLFDLKNNTRISLMDGVGDISEINGSLYLVRNNQILKFIQ